MTAAFYKCTLRLSRDILRKKLVILRHNPGESLSYKTA